MFAWLLIASGLSAPSSVQPVETKLQGLSPAEADALVAKLQQAQVHLKAGKSETFELLAGAPASYPASKIAPRTAFSAMDFRHPWSIERKPTTGLWQPYELDYFPQGADSSMWRVTVTVGQIGQLTRVEMLRTAPPPF